MEGEAGSNTQNGLKGRVFSEGKAGLNSVQAYFKTLSGKKLQHDGIGLENEPGSLIKMLASMERKMLWKTDPKVWIWASFALHTSQLILEGKCLVDQ